MRKGEETRRRILEIAETAVLTKGFNGTSIDGIIAEAGLTKSGFLYHFSDKSALAEALLERYVAQDEAIFDDVFSRADALSDDPLQAMLIALNLFADLFDDLPGGHPGCMVAAVCYHERLFARRVREVNRAALMNWRRRFCTAFRAIAIRYPPRDEVSLDDLADMFTSIVDGGIIVSRALDEPRLLGAQMRLMRSYVKLLFSPPSTLPTPN